MFNDDKALLSHYFGHNTVEEIDTHTDHLIKIWEPHPTSDKIVAAAWFTRDMVEVPCGDTVRRKWSAHIMLMAVACPFRRRGYGTKLVAEIQRAYPTITLNVYPENRAALFLYTKLGFKPVMFDPTMYDGTGGWFMEYQA